MGSDEPLDDRCGAKRRSDDGYCRLYPATDDDGEPINGRCRFHGGHENIGAPEGSANHLQHGATASHETLRRHLDAADLAWIEDLADRYRRLAGLEPDDPRTDLIEDVSVASYKRWAARSEAIANDLTTEAVVDTDAEGRPVIRTEEHYLAGMADRLAAEIRRTLKEIGVLGDDSETISTRSAAQIIAAAVEEDATDG